MHVKASVSARMSLVRLVHSILLFYSTVFFPFYWTNKWWWNDDECSRNSTIKSFVIYGVLFQLLNSGMPRLNRIQLQMQHVIHRYLLCASSRSLRCLWIIKSLLYESTGGTAPHLSAPHLPGSLFQMLTGHAGFMNDLTSPGPRPHQHT